MTKHSPNDFVMLKNLLIQAVNHAGGKLELDLEEVRNHVFSLTVEPDGKGHVTLTTRQLTKNKLPPYFNNDIMTNLN